MKGWKIKFDFQFIFWISFFYSIMRYIFLCIHLYYFYFHFILFCFRMEFLIFNTKIVCTTERKVINVKKLIFNFQFFNYFSIWIWWLTLLFALRSPPGWCQGRGRWAWCPPPGSPPGPCPAPPASSRSWGWRPRTTGREATASEGRT